MQRSIPFLWALVIILLVLNLVLLDTLNLARLTAIESLGKIETMLDKMAKEVIVYEVTVDQAVPLQADIPFNRTMDIPLKTVIPINQTLSVPFQTPAGEITLQVPVQTNVPIDMVVPVDFNQTINVDTVVQLKTTLPVTIEIAKTPLADYLKQAQSDIARLRSRLMLRRGAAVVEPTAPPTSSGSAAPAAADSSATPALSAASEPAADVSRVSQRLAVDTDLSSAATADQSRLGQCAHPYWPLWRGTTWTFNSQATSYLQRVDDILNDEAFVSTQYEGQDIQSSLICSPEGLGGVYLGDMRRIGELGNFSFSNPRGTFLPPPAALEQPGSPWRQELDVGGVLQALQGDTPVAGKITRGRAVAVYTPIRVESVETPLGTREALRVDQKLDFELEASFDLAGQSVRATEKISLSNVYWFAKDIGLVKAHWQGGALQWEATLGDTPVRQEAPIPALPEDQLVFVCVTLADQSVQCAHMARVSEYDLTAPPQSELQVKSIVLPNPVASAESTDLPEPSPGVATEEPAGDSDRPSLPEYIDAVHSLGRQLSEAAQQFGAAALLFRAGQLTLDQFQAAFSDFAPQIRDLIQQISQLSPPREAEALHQKLVTGMGKCNQAVDLMEDWFASPNSDTKEAATLLVTDCVEEVTGVEEELTALAGEGLTQ